MSISTKNLRRRTSWRAANSSVHMLQVRWQLTGFFECDFWNRVLLQAAQQDVAIRHAVICLGHLHEMFEQDGSVVLDEFALHHYNTAIRNHVQSLAESTKSTETVDSYLASCVLFLVIEVLQGHYESAISLLEKATNLLHEEDYLTPISSAYPVKSFESVLRRLQLQAAGLLTTEYGALGMPPLPRSTRELSIPTSFNSLTEAKDCLELHGYASHLSRRNTQQPFVSGPTKFVGQADWLPRWKMAFDKTLRSLARSITERDKRAADTLRMRALIFQIMMGIRKQHVTTSPDEMSWDCWHQTFADILALAERVCSASPATLSNSTRASFTVDFGFVGPVYDTARVCRDPVIRRKAIRLLRAYPCREGLWDSLFAAASAERQMRLEESSIPGGIDQASDVPAWARIVTVAPSKFPVGQQRWASVVYTRQKESSDAAGPQQFREAVEW